MNALTSLKAAVRIYRLDVGQAIPAPRYLSTGRLQFGELITVSKDHKPTAGGHKHLYARTAPWCRRRPDPQAEDRFAKYPVNAAYFELAIRLLRVPNGDVE